MAPLLLSPAAAAAFPPRTEVPGADSATAAATTGVGIGVLNTLVSADFGRPSFGLSVPPVGSISAGSAAIEPRGSGVVAATVLSQRQQHLAAAASALGGEATSMSEPQAATVAPRFATGVVATSSSPAVGGVVNLRANATLLNATISESGASTQPQDYLDLLMDEDDDSDAFDSDGGAGEEEEEDEEEEGTESGESATDDDGDATLGDVIRL
jgi:hypothetical protein